MSCCAGPSRVATDPTLKRFAAATAGTGRVDHLKSAVRRAELDALIVVGDDHAELYQDDNPPSFVVYRGATIRNVPPMGFRPDWARRASLLRRKRAAGIPR
jgi:3-O-methylgallate 3,4-dioxygenase